MKEKSIETQDREELATQSVKGDINSEELSATEGQREIKGRFWSLNGSFPNIADLFIIFGAVIIFQIAGHLISYLLGLNFDAQGLDSSDDVIRYSAQKAYGLFSLVSYSSAMLLSSIFVVLYKHFRGDREALLKMSNGKNVAHIILWGVLLTICMGITLEPLVEIMPRVDEFPGRGLYSIISLVIVAPIFEEFICRGVILEALYRRGGAFMAIFVSAIFFALLHYSNITLVINSFVMGVMLGYFYIRTRSIIVPITLHAINNALAYILLYTGNANLSLSKVVLNIDIYYAIYAVSLLFLIVSFIKIGQTPKLRQNK